jgi:hypothetical protein
VTDKAPSPDPDVRAAHLNRQAQVSLASPSRRFLAATLVQVALYALAFALIGTEIWPGQPFKQRVALAFLLMGIAIGVGWLGALWARRARPEIPYSEELESIRRQMVRRGRLGFAVLIGIAGGAVGFVTPRFPAAPR